MGSSVAVLLARAAGGGAAFALSILLAQILGVRALGIYFLATAVASFAIVFGRAGQENAVLRFGAIAASREDWSEMAGLRRSSRRLVLGASVAVATILVLAAPFLARVIFEEPGLEPLLRILALGVPVTALATVDIELVRARGRVGLAAVLEALPSPLLSILIVVPLAILFGLEGAVGGTVLAAAAVLVVVLLTRRRFTPDAARAMETFDHTVLLRAGIPLVWVGISAMVLTLTDTLMLGILADARSVGLYGAAVRVAALASTALAAVNAVVAPRFAALYSEGRLDELSELARNATGKALLLALPILAIGAAAPGTVLSLFGPEFSAGGTVLLVLLLGHGVNVLTGPVGTLLMMSGHEKILRNNVLVAGAVNLALNVALVPGLGALGAAIATAVSLALLNVLSLVQVYRRMGITVIGLRSEKAGA